MQSVDCKSFKLALGVPFHSSNVGTYCEADVLPLNLQRQKSVASFIIKSSTNITSCSEEVKFTPETHYAKRADKI